MAHHNYTPLYSEVGQVSLNLGSPPLVRRGPGL